LLVVKIFEIGYEFVESYFALVGKPLSNYFSSRNANFLKVV